MVEFYRVYKNNHEYRWCENPLPVSLFAPFISRFTPAPLHETQRSHTRNPLWFSLYEICFPQKYMINPMQFGGIRTAILQLLFSSKDSPVPADRFFSRWGTIRTCPLRAATDWPCYAGNTNTIKKGQGERKEN